MAFLLLLFYLRLKDNLDIDMSLFLLFLNMQQIISIFFKKNKGLGDAFDVFQNRVRDEMRLTRILSWSINNLVRRSTKD